MGWERSCWIWLPFFFFWEGVIIPVSFASSFSSARRFGEGLYVRALAWKHLVHVNATAEDVLNQTAWPALWIAVSSPSSESLVLVQGLKNRATMETGMEAGAWTSTVQTSSHHGHRGFYSYSLWGILSSPNGSTRLGTASWPTGLGFYFRPFCREGITDLFSLEHSCFSLHLDLRFLLVLHLLRPYEIFCEGTVFLLRLPLTFREGEVTQWAG